jgi:hypothetical protein
MITDRTALSGGRPRRRAATLERLYYEPNVWLWESFLRSLCAHRRELRQQLIGDCGSACGEDRPFEDDGETTIWFKPIDCRE